MPFRVLDEAVEAPGEEGPYTNTAEVTSDALDPDLEDNEAHESVRVEPCTIYLPVTLRAVDST